MSDAAGDQAATEKKAKKNPLASPPPPILAAASAAWIRDNHHPRLSEAQACALMARVFPGSRYQCRALACPTVCPRHPDFGEPAPPPAWSAPPPPPMTPVEAAAAERGLASVRGLHLFGAGVLGQKQVPRLGVAVDQALGDRVLAAESPVDYRLDPVDSPTNDDQPLTAAEEAIWAEQVEAWTASPATLASAAPAPDPPLASAASARPAPSASSYPPCLACGKIRPIMLVLAPIFGKPAATLCAPCAR